MGRLVGISLCVVIVGGLMFLLLPFDDARYLNTRIRLLEPQLSGHESAIYLIKEATVCCRACPKYEQIKKKETEVLFVFHPDFSDNDINNFCVAFSVPDTTKTKKMNPRWEEVYKRLTHRNDNREYSYFIMLSKKAMVTEIWRF